ncbi:fasciclin domain-containing protein [Robertkochia aurantiaca]|uniref:fasciclin domain-containing protein n=1 Tax=Robertkochia aurantiaca TaxID=2873700 RepID=UPI001CCAE501|nr:fasciclin domain-containing protein [Robertkochia sp. 3YJGBD-33]
MKTFRYFIFLFLSILVLAIGCKEETNEPSDTRSEVAETTSHKSGEAFIEDDVSTPNILQIAIGSPDHTILVKAVQAAELENALVNAGPLMVFAPTDEAFKALPEGTLDELLKPENKGDLANILKYHVTPGNYTKDFLKKFKKVGQANDQSAPVEVKEDEVYVGGARIIASVPAGNGIVHVVDKVMLPPAEE